MGLDMRIIAVDVSRYPKKYPNRGEIVLVNPLIVRASGRQTSREGCLSVPEFTGNVTRADEITISGTSLGGGKVEFSTNGFEAVVLQHEIDHLDGILFLDRVSSLKTDVFRRKQVCLPKE
jgi:peptide deformylase